MFGVTTVCFMVTLAISMRWAIQDCLKSQAIVEEEKRPIVPIHLELVRLILITPAIISSMSVVCMIRPSAAFVLELLMAIFSCVVVGNMTRYFLALLGEPPLPQQLLARVPKRRWWCGCFCGGVNDTQARDGLGLEQDTTSSLSSRHTQGNVHGQDIHDRLHSNQLHSAIFQHGAS